MKEGYIYKVTNLINGRIYIGQHDGSKPKYYASGKLIKGAIKKFGIDNFIREILIKGDFNQYQLDELEIYFIKENRSYFFDYPEIGYNLTKGGQGLKEYKHSDKSIQKIRNGAPNKTAVIQFNLYGEIIRSFSSIMEAHRETGIGHSGIYRACNGRDINNKSAGGFLWMFLYDFNNGLSPKYSRPKNERPVAQHTKKGDFIRRFNSVTEASAQTGIGRSNIANSLIAKKNYYCGGFLFKYI